jgi:two-component system phosphate regulon sensor histidine kinase PhoR
VLLRHDAQLQIESELGRGSTFTCVFPDTRVVSNPVKASAAQH